MFRKFIALVVLVTVSGLFIYFISGITRKDVIAINAFSHQVEAEPLTAGDIVVLPKRGAISRICNAVVAPEELENLQKSEVYFNRAGRIVSWVTGIAEQIGLLKGSSDAASAPRGTVPFVGSASSLVSTNYTYLNPEACECAMVRELAMGERVCTVSASLIETKEVSMGENGGFVSRPVQRSLAVVLRRHVVFMPEEAFEACGLPVTEAARNVQQQLCSDGSALPIDVRVRSFLNLIDSEPLVLQEVSLQPD